MAGMFSSWFWGLLGGDSLQMFSGSSGLGLLQTLLAGAVLNGRPHCSTPALVALTPVFCQSPSASLL